MSAGSISTVQSGPALQLSVDGVVYAPGWQLLPVTLNLAVSVAGIASNVTAI